MPNTQPISQRDLHPQGHLHLHHIFPTIQGEGPFAGRPAIFVRLAGCNLQCPACDTDYTNADQRKVTPQDILMAVASFVPKLWQAPVLVVITGGEPFRQNIVPLCELLLKDGYQVQIETNGTLWLTDMGSLSVAWQPDLTIVCSPKTGRLAEGIMKYAKHFKYILQGWNVASDGLPISTMGTDNQVARPPKGATVYVQPLDETLMHGNRGKALSNNDNNIIVCKHSALRFGYRLSVQTHKIVNLE